MKTEKISLREMIKCGVSLLINNLSILLPAFFIWVALPTFLFCIFIIPFDRLYTIFEMLGTKNVSITLQNLGIDSFGNLKIIIPVGISIFLIAAVLCFGFIKILLEVYDTGTSNLKRLFSNYRYIPRAVGLIFLLILLMLIFAPIYMGSLYFLSIFVKSDLIVNVFSLLMLGIYILALNLLILFFYISILFILDKNMGIFNALENAISLTKGNRIRIFLLYSLIIIFYILSRWVMFIPNVSFGFLIFLYYAITLTISLVWICILVCIYRKLLTLKV